VILPVRPHFFFDKLPEDSPVLLVPVPRRSSDSPTQLELMLLLAIGRIVGIDEGRGVFEIGTYKGMTALALSQNFPFVHSLDLDPSLSDELLMETSVVRLQGHSMTFDFSPYKGLCALVFIDGAHDEETVYSDSLNALELLPPAPCAIVWHDYDPDRWPGVVSAVRRFGEGVGQPVYRVEDTHLAVYLREGK
jgi:hypothetical protein